MDDSESTYRLSINDPPSYSVSAICVFSRGSTPGLQFGRYMFALRKLFGIVGDTWSQRRARLPLPSFLRK